MMNRKILAFIALCVCGMYAINATRVPSGEGDFFTLIEKNDLAGVQGALQDKSPDEKRVILTQKFKDETPVVFALKHRAVKIAHHLLEVGGKLRDRRAVFGRTSLSEALTEAIITEDIDLVDKLLDFMAAIAATPATGRRGSLSSLLARNIFLDGRVFDMAFKLAIRDKTLDHFGFFMWHDQFPGKPSSEYENEKRKLHGRRRAILSRILEFAASNMLKGDFVNLAKISIRKRLEEAIRADDVEVVKLTLGAITRYIPDKGDRRHILFTSPNYTIFFPEHVWKLVEGQRKPMPIETKSLPVLISFARSELEAGDLELLQKYTKPGKQLIDAINTDNTQEVKAIEEFAKKFFLKEDLAELLRFVGLIQDEQGKRVGISVLMLAASKGNEAIVRELIQFACDHLSREKQTEFFMDQDPSGQKASDVATPSIKKILKPSITLGKLACGPRVPVRRHTMPPLQPVAPPEEQGRRYSEPEVESFLPSELVTPLEPPTRPKSTGPPL